MYIDKIIFRAIVYYSKSCNINATQTIQNIRKYFPFCTFANSTFYNWYRDITSVNNIIPPKRKIRIPKREYRTEILRRLQENPSTSARAIARSLRISHSTVLDYIYNVLGYHRTTCRIIPHQLTDKLRQQRILYSKVQLAVLEEAEAVQYKNIISLDESWLFYSYFSSHCYLKREEERPTVVRRQQGEKKVMLTAAVSGAGVAGEIYLPVNATMTAQQFVNAILSSLNTWWESRWRSLTSDEQNAIIHSTEKALIAAQKVIDEEDQLHFIQTVGGDALQLMCQFNETPPTETTRPIRAAAQSAVQTVQALGQIEARSDQLFKCPESPCFIHFDNAPAHNADSTGQYLQTTHFIRIPHPPYSPDISVCDYYLFGRLKNALQQYNTQTLPEIQQATHAILDAIPEDEWFRVFQEWKTRLLWIINHNGDYYYKESHPHERAKPKVLLPNSPVQVVGPGELVSPAKVSSTQGSSSTPQENQASPSLSSQTTSLPPINNPFASPTSEHIASSTDPNPLFSPTSSPTTSSLSSQTTSLPPINNDDTSRLSQTPMLYSSVYVCELCSYRTPHYGHYKQHVMRHTDDRPFKCPIDGCKYAAFQKSDLDKHMHVHEGDSKRHQIRFRKNLLVSQPPLPPFFSRKMDYALSDFVNNPQTDFSFPDFSSTKT